MNISQDGWLDVARKVSSPNYNERPCGCPVDLLVIHAISLPPGQFDGPWIESFFQNCLDASAHPYFEEIRDLEVSAHLLIRRDGEIVQFVSLDERAWHAGRSCWHGREACNDFSIGIELEGSDDLPFDERQYAALREVIPVIQSRYPGISNQRIVGHSDIAPGRKTDPGPFFDWSRIGLQPPEAASEPQIS